MGGFEKWFCEKCGVDVESVRVLVVIPILNPPKWFFSDVIGRLSSQSIKPQILLINSGDEIQNGIYEVVNISKKEFNHANTRNIALGYEADFYLFITQDAKPKDENLIKNLLVNFQDNFAMVSYARQLPYENADPIEIFARTANYPSERIEKSITQLQFLGIKTFFSSDSCAMYRGSYFRSVSGFKPNLNTNEDMEFAARTILNDYKVVYEPKAEVYHSHNFTFLETYRRYKEIGKFFKDNHWILDEVAKHQKVESTGIKQVWSEMKYLLKKAPLFIVKSALLAIVKYIAFKSYVK